MFKTVLESAHYDEGCFTFVAYGETIREADNRIIRAVRQFNLEHRQAFDERELLDGEWNTYELDNGDWIQ